MITQKKNERSFQLRAISYQLKRTFVTFDKLCIYGCCCATIVVRTANHYKFFSALFVLLLEVIKECGDTAERLLVGLLNLDAELNLHLGDASEVLDGVEVGYEAY